ncbi:unnamed protein product, partial [Musa acuminata var. zebrina]
MDPLRVTVGVSRLELTGFRVNELLYEEHGVIPELAGMRSVTLVFNRGTSMEHIERMITALSHLSTTFLDENRSQNQVGSGVITQTVCWVYSGAQSKGGLLREEEESGHWRKPREDMWRAHLHVPTRCSGAEPRRSRNQGSFGLSAGCEEQGSCDLGSSRSSTLFHVSVQR